MRKYEPGLSKIHYISAGNGLSAIYVQNEGADSLYYCYTDYQGNLLVVTNDTGGEIERLAYDPWGARRNPTNWSLPDTRDKHLFARGYTMHEHLDGFGLINMNGRAYDPMLARFLSPDPFIQAPGNWGNYNRYGYCLNNPLIYNDPTGNKWKWPKWENRHWIPLFGQFDYLVGVLNENTTGLRQKMVDAGVPDFSVGAQIYNGGGWDANAQYNGQTVFNTANAMKSDPGQNAVRAIDNARSEYYSKKLLERNVTRNVSITEKLTKEFFVTSAYQMEGYSEMTLKEGEAPLEYTFDRDTQEHESTSITTPIGLMTEIGKDSYSSGFSFASKGYTNDGRFFIDLSIPWGNTSYGTTIYVNPGQVQRNFYNNLDRITVGLKSSLPYLPFFYGAGYPIPVY